MGRIAIVVLIGGFALFGLALVLALVQIARPFPVLTEKGDVFGFGAVVDQGAARSLPALQRYPARDGTQLAYRFYASAGDPLLVFVHGSSYHGAGYHALATAISSSGAAKVLLPNLRGHYMSGQKRGDIDAIGQLEDDVADLVEFARKRGHAGPLVLGGHSSGGGFAIRFAGGPYGHLATAYLLLSPILPLAPTIRGGTAGGWARLHQPRLFGLLFLNAVGISGFNGLTIIQFNKPEAFWDGTETLAYSYRLNTAYHPRYDYRSDIAAMGDDVLLLVGADDEANDGTAYPKLFEESGSSAEIVVLPGVNHFGVFRNEQALERMSDWLKSVR